VLARARRTGRRLMRDVHEVRVPIDPRRHRL
jgi:hypothetical protein